MKLHLVSCTFHAALCVRPDHNVPPAGTATRLAKHCIGCHAASKLIAKLDRSFQYVHSPAYLAFCLCAPRAPVGILRCCWRGAIDGAQLSRRKLIVFRHQWRQAGLIEAA
jgi:hypothetical protein